MKQIYVGQRVRHNYADGHGDGTVMAFTPKSDNRLEYEVQFDSGFRCSYTYNDDNQEIVPIGA